MADDVLDEMLKTHQAFAARLQARADAALPQATAAADLAAREREDLLAQLKTQLEAATAARDQVVKRYDDEIKRLKDAIAWREAEGRTPKATPSTKGGGRRPR